MVIQRVRGPNWYTPEGVELKRALIRKKGVPCLKNWRPITLTIDPSKFDGPVEAYLKGKDNMRRFLNSLRELLGRDSARWCWKLEFQQNGWPHWHLAFDHTSKLSEAELKAIQVIWGLGITNTKRIREGSFDYLFKYVTKESYRGQDGDLLPDWFLDYMDIREEDGKPITFHRARFWQTSKGFYTGNQDDQRREEKDPETSRFPLTVREAVDIRARSVRVLAQDEFGEVCKSVQITLRRCWKGKIEPFFARLCLTGRAAAPSPRSYICGYQEIEKLCHGIHQKQKLRRLRPHQRRNEGLQIRRYLQAMGVEMPF